MGQNRLHELGLITSAVFLLSEGFQSSNADSSLFVLTQAQNIVILLLYVDDMFITGKSSTLFDPFLTILNQQFAITNLGQVHYFLGLQVQTFGSGLFLSQIRYATTIRLKAGRLDSKPTPNSICFNHLNPPQRLMILPYIEKLQAPFSTHLHTARHHLLQ